VAAGMLAPVTELHYGEDALLRLNLKAADVFGTWIDALEARTGRSVGYRKTGTLMVARDPDENAALERVWRHQISLDLDARRLKGADARALEPALSARIRGGVFVPEDHQVDPAAMMHALIDACKAAGVRFLAERAVSVSGASGTVDRVVTHEGTEIEADAVVVAAGPWSGSLDGLPAELGVIRPVKGQLIELRARPGAEHLLSRNLRGEDVYMVPRADGRLVIGATVEEKGFDVSVSAGAVLELLRAAYEVLPGIAEMELVHARAGLRPGTPDNAPLLGKTSRPGLFVAAGHYRNGILLAPLSGRLMAQLLSTGVTPVEIEGFSPDRFAGVAAS
jgi:glycine oxidase